MKLFIHPLRHTVAIVVCAFVAGCNSHGTAQPIEFIFDGIECRVDGATELPTGEHLIPLNNLTDQDIYLWIGQALEGNTWQDSLALQTYPTEWVPAPDWLPKARITFVSPGPRVADRYMFGFEFESPGEYHVWAENKSAMKLWPCAPISVVQATTE